MENMIDQIATCCSPRCLPCFPSGQWRLPYVNFNSFKFCRAPNEIEPPTSLPPDINNSETTRENGIALAS